jgi:hypothetical protein
LDYLRQKKARRDAASEIIRNARRVGTDTFDRLAAGAADARRRSASELPAGANTLVLDAAFLVPSRRAAGFQRTAAREARKLAGAGYGLTLTGPWPPYTFIQE